MMQCVIYMVVPIRQYYIFSDVKDALCEKSQYGMLLITHSKKKSLFVSYYQTGAALPSSFLVVRNKIWSSEAIYNVKVFREVFTKIN